MADLKAIRVRINSVKKTRQITQAMKLVAAAKLRGADARAKAAKPYQHQLRDVLARVAARAGEVSDPLLRKPEATKHALLVVFASDRGLCGGFNNNLLRRAVVWVGQKKAEGLEVTVRVYGRKARDFFKTRGVAVADAVVQYDKTPKMDLVRAVSDHMVSGFTSGTYDEVYLGYNVFVNAATQRPEFVQVLPLSVDAPGAAAEASLVDYLYEPSPSALLAAILPLYLRTLVLQSFLETEAGEHGARMMAMDNATRNASDLIARLTLEYNRARQAAITKEITEIVAGAEAL